MCFFKKIYIVSIINRSSILKLLLTVASQFKENYYARKIIFKNKKILTLELLQIKKH